MKPFGPFLDGYHDTADQLREHLRRRADLMLAKHESEKAALSSTAEFEARVRRLREEVLQSLGGLPELPPEVPATVTGTLETDAFTVEKLLLETIPGTKATAVLYLPKGVAYPVPGVLFVCGHSLEAKAAPRYQQVCRALVRLGIAVLAIDPVGQGERMQYIDPVTKQELVRWGVIEHSHAGFQCHVAGFGIARYFIADAKQALTYLASRPEVDAGRLGLTGNSGGGTQSAYLTFFDDRLSCSAPCTYITSRDHYMTTGQAHDSEQNFYRAVAMGLDYDDLLAPHAPKPLLIGAVASDFFCVEGTLQSFEHLRRAYDLYGAGDRLHVAIAPGVHGFNAYVRDQVSKFFRRYLLGDQEAEIKPGLTNLAGPVESPLPPEPCEPEPEENFEPHELQVTKSGQVAFDYPEAKRIFDLNLDAWRKRRASTGNGPAGAAAGTPGASGSTTATKLERLRRAVLADRPRPPMWVREIQTGVDKETGIAWAHRYTFTEPRIAVPMIGLQDPQAATDDITVIAWDEGTHAVESRRNDVIAAVRRYGRVLLFDPRGTGAAAQRPINPRPPGTYDTTYKLNYDAMMLGDSLFAMRCFDALRVLEYAHRNAKTVRVAGEGVAGLILLAAAVLDGDVRPAAGDPPGSGGAAEAFKTPLRSFEDIVTEPLFSASHVLEVFGLLDFPDIGEMLSLL